MYMLMCASCQFISGKAPCGVSGARGHKEGMWMGP